MFTALINWLFPTPTYEEVEMPTVKKLFKVPDLNKGCKCNQCDIPEEYSFLDTYNCSKLYITHHRHGISVFTDEVDTWCTNDLDQVRELGHLLLDIADWHEKWEKT